ncbi:condensation domain-containing protein, partial [Mucilaginibacter sp. RCC_168]|uniref:condensation domain-containing protein n=1 Tax=Mucilaginibacter sp. RCC_168 TaxID=3239221 RepID=UPI0035263287
TRQNNGAVQELILGQDIKQLLQAKSDSSGSTLFMILLSAVNALLYRYTGQQDLITGTAVAGRDHVDLEDQIGLYVNTLALRTQLEGSWSFDKLLSAVKEITLGAFEHQQYPFDLLVDELLVERDMSRMPIFDVMVTLQNIELSGNGSAEELDSISVSEYHIMPTIAKFDL